MISSSDMPLARVWILAHGSHPPVGVANGNNRQNVVLVDFLGMRGSVSVLVVGRRVFAPLPVTTMTRSYIVRTGEK